MFGKSRMLLAAAAAAMAGIGGSTDRAFSAPATTGIQNHRGGPGTRAQQRAALKRRNRASHRKACR